MRLLIALSLVLIIQSTSVTSQDNDYDYNEEEDLPYELRCPTELCSNTLHPDSDTWTLEQQQLTEYHVEGHKICFYINRASKFLRIECDGENVLESESMPRFTFEQTFSMLTLSNCPLPVNRSLFEVFSAINASLNLYNLELTALPEIPPLRRTHFLNLTSVTELGIYSHVDTVPAETSILGPLTNLKNLIVKGVELSYQELSSLPRSLNCLSLFGPALHFLPKTLNETLTLLPQPYRIWLGSRYGSISRGSLMWKCQDKPKRSTGSSVEEVILNGWPEKDVVALSSCDSLRELEIEASNMTSLPERWLTACPNLQEVKIKDNERKITLHSKVLEGSCIKKLLVQNCDLETLNQLWLKSARNLVDVSLPWDRITVV